MLRRSSTAASAGVASVGLAGLALVIVGIAEKAASDFHPRPEVHVLIAVTAAVAGIFVDRLRAAVAEQQARKRRDEMLDDDLAVWPLPSLADADPYVLGVFPVAGPERTLEGRLGPYVRRDVDEAVEAALLEHPFVVAFGPPRSGKSRTVFEAARRALPDARAIVPEGPDELARLMEISPPLDCAPYPAVIWLDGLDRFLPALDVDLMDALGGDRGLAIVATIREEDYARVLEAGGQLGETGRRVLTRARGIRVPDNLSERERADAAAALPDFAGDGPLGTDVTKTWQDGHIPVEEPRGKSSLGIVTPKAGRRTRHGIDVSERTLDVDWLAVATLAVVLVLAAGTAWRIHDVGFTEEQVSFADRLQAAKADHPDRWIPKSRVLPLRDPDQKSYVMSFIPPVHKESTEVRVYDQHGDTLRRAFRFRPQPALGKRHGEKLGWRFFFRTTKVDVDRNGSIDVVAAFRPAGRPQGRVLPVLLFNDGKRYLLKGLGSETSHHESALAKTEGRLRDPNNKPHNLKVYEVADFAVAVINDDVKFIAGSFVGRRHPSGTNRIEVHAWRLGTVPKSPWLGTRCKLPGGKPVEIESSATHLFHDILGAWKKVDRFARC
jgi:hypothetical protein